MKYSQFKRFFIKRKKYSIHQSENQGNRSRMYPVMSGEELDTVLNKLPDDIELLIESNF